MGFRVQKGNAAAAVATEVALPPDQGPPPLRQPLDPVANGAELFGKTSIPQARDAGTVAEFRNGSQEIKASSYRGVFNDLMDQETGALQKFGNDVQLLPDGIASFAEREKMIRGAKQSILMQTFIFNDDETGWHTARLLAEKAKQGVKVCVIYDGVGSNRAQNDIYDFMRASGVEVREYADPYAAPLKLNNRWHEKLLITDGQVAITGGMNIADEYAKGGSAALILRHGKTPTAAWRDMDARISGPTLQDMVLRFAENWERLGEPLDGNFIRKTLDRVPPPKLKGGVSVRFITNEAGSSQTPITKAYRLAIMAAQKSITIENPYFLPTKEIRDELIAAAKRGVKIRVMTNSAETNDIALLPDIARHYYDELVAAGIEIQEKHGGTLHAKTACFDDEYSIIGSANLNRRSNGLDSEGVICVSDPLTARALKRRFETGLSECTPVTARQLADEDWLTNAKQWAASLFARFF